MTVNPLLCDIYAGDLGGKPDIAKLATAGAPWHGLWLKATEGLYYPQRSSSGPYGDAWFLHNWPLARTAAGTRYGFDWFRGAYHYHRIDQDAVAQADAYLALIERGGGWAYGDLWPMIDVESAENPVKPGKQRIVDSVSAWVERVKAVLGREIVLYGGEYLAENGVTSRMGCSMLSVARYAQDLPPVVYNRIGWNLSGKNAASPLAQATVLEWQYCGDGEAYLKNYPKISPMGAIDIGAVIVNGDDGLAWLRRNLFTTS